MTVSGPIDDAVNADILRFFPELVSELGGDVGTLIREAGLAPGSEGQASYRRVAALLERTAAALGRPDLGLRLAARQGGAMFGPLGQVMRNAATLGEALDYVSRHAHAHSLAAAIWMRRGGPDGLVFFGHDLLVDHTEARTQLMEQIVLVGHLAAAEITGDEARARRVHFRHAPRSQAETYRRYFHCEVRFGQDEDGLFFYEKDLARPIISGDPIAYRRAADHIDHAFGRRPPFHAQVRAVLLQRLHAEPCSNAEIASVLKLHVRTLRRRLSDEGTSFQKVKDQVRRDLLRFYLQETDLGFARIAAKLGFTEQAVMSRRCQDWFSRSPTRFRAEAKGARAG